MGASTLSELRARAHEKACRYRAIDRLVEGAEFAKLYKEKPALVERMVNNGEKDNLLRELHTRVRTIADLRLEAKKLGVKNYSRLTREELECYV